jgi:choline dehydrogenase-like flavoprotein
MARMGDDSRFSVVNGDCRVHGLANLYLAGASVFSTGGHANPTLPAVALALRLGQHLARIQGCDLQEPCAPPPPGGPDEGQIAQVARQPDGIDPPTTATAAGPPRNT